MTRSAILAVVLAAAASCRNGDLKPPPSGGGAVPPKAAAGPAVVLRPEGREVSFRVEVVRTDAERQRGLMYREHLDADAGMLFIFERPGPLSFWMRNTFIPLDIIFIGADRRIVGVVENAEPRTETSRRVDGDSQYVLEINGGLSARLGLRPGTPVEFRNVPL
jgi:uncharacterized membrane protein (UPF0127 family)